jgi:hypothetical protein
MFSFTKITSRGRTFNTAARSESKNDLACLRSPTARSDKRGFDLISDALPFGRLWYTEPNDAVEYAKFFSRSDDAVIRVYDVAGNAIDTHEHAGEFKEWRIQAMNSDDETRKKNEHYHRDSYRDLPHARIEEDFRKSSSRSRSGEVPAGVGALTKSCFSAASGLIALSQPPLTLLRSNQWVIGTPRDPSAFCGVNVHVILLQFKVIVSTRLPF